MKKIYLLTDYLNRFSSKHNAAIYKNGMDKDLLERAFLNFNYEAIFIPLSKVNFRNQNWKGKIVLYTSQEDVGYYYKSYIEDIVYGLEIAGAILIPSFKYLKAHSNKVFMEILRDLSPIKEMGNLRGNYFGTYEEAFNIENEINYPTVIKGAEGAMSVNVALARNKSEFAEVIKRIAATRNFKEEFRELVRKIKYEGYQKQSKFRKKFIIQDFLPELSNDWKVLIFGNKYFIIERNVRKNDFRASGGGINTFGSKVQVPRGIFEFSRTIIDYLNVPMISLDIVSSKNEFFLLEYQTLYFGTSGQWKSDCYYEQSGNEFIKKENNLSLEEIYVESIVQFIN